LKKRFLACVAVAVIAAPSNALNLFVNPGFETADTSEWVLDRPDTVTRGVVTFTTDAKREGAKGLQATITKVDTANWGIRVYTPAFAATTGNTYDFSFWAKSDSIRPLTIGFQPAGGGYISASPELTINTTWTQFSYKVTAASTEPLQFTLFLGAKTNVGVYSFDDFDLQETGAKPLPPMVHPEQGAWYTGVYRNLFAEFGYAEDKIDAKVNGAFDQLFFGDSATQRLFRIVPGDTTMGFIDATDYVLTEGQSYGMMIAVQLDRKDIFDKLWKFAKTHMQQKSGDQQGYFAWKVANKAPFTPADVNPAPDGEEYFVTALYLADKRWTSVEGIAAYQNYKQQADSILHYMLKSRASLGPLVDPTRKQIVFSPDGNNPFSDPSYHLPAFYRLWGAFAGHNNALWNAMADTSEAFFARSLKKSPYGINPNYATFDGDPAIFSSAEVKEVGELAQRAYRYDTVYAADAHRTPMNIGMYWNWFQADTNAWWQTDKFLGFLREQGGATLKYNQVYNLAGQPCAPNNWGPAESQVGANAAAVLASKDPANWVFVKAAFEVATPDSSYRYYNGMVYMLGLLNAAGKFKAWGSPGLVGGVAVKPGVGNAARLSVRLNGQNLQVSGVVGSVRLLDARGREAARTVADGSVSFVLPHSGLWVVDAGPAGRRTVALP